MTPIQAIRKFFELDGRTITVAEIRDLGYQERQALARLCAEALGVRLMASEAA